MKVHSTRRAWQLLLTVVCTVAAPPGSRAAPAERPGAANAPAGPRAAVPGEDDELYRCRAAEGEVKVSFKPGIEFADLVTWAMSFTCKTFVYAPRLANRSLSSIITDKTPLQPPVGFLGGVIGQKIPGAEALLGTSIPSFTVLFQALAHSQHVDILSAPHVMTTDHVEANLSSGDLIPFQTGITGAPGSVGVPLGQVERQEVGLTFKVTPHVGASGRIRLDIDLSIEDVLPEPGDFGPSTSKRRIVNSVVVGDQESAILGGLVTRKVGRRETKIPLLGDLPVLGVLFRQRETFADQADLVVLITPYIVTDSVDGARSVERVLEGRAEFLSALERLDAMGFRARPDGRWMRGLVAEIALRVG